MRFGFDFSVGKVEYHVRVDDSCELAFWARSHDPMAFGLDESDNWDMPEFYYAFDSLGNCPQAVRVFRNVARVLAAWAHKTRPPFLYFRCSSLKKYSLYLRLLERHRLDDLYDIQRIEKHAYLSLRVPSEDCTTRSDKHLCTI